MLPFLSPFQAGRGRGPGQARAGQMQAPVESGLLYKSASDPVYGPLGLAQWVSVLRVTLLTPYQCIGQPRRRTSCAQVEEQALWAPAMP